MTKLFAPLQVGAATLQHRVAMAPLTRYRAEDNWVPGPLMKGKLSPTCEFPAI